MPGTFDAMSRLQLSTCDPRLAFIMERALLVCPFTFHITQGSRTIKQQKAYFVAGTSKIDPDAYADLAALYKAAKHVTGPGMKFSRACDVHLSGQPGGNYDKNALCFIAGLVTAISKEMGVSIRWGADFDKDGKIAEAGTFIDMPHFEIDA